MEQFPLIEKESGINRVAGFEPEREDKILDYFKETFQENIIDSREKEKTLELVEIINRINVEMQEFLDPYGIKALEIPADSIHILDRSKLTENESRKIDERTETAVGAYYPAKQGILMMKDYDENKLSFLQTLIHEMIHMQAFSSLQAVSEEASDITLKKRDERMHMNVRRAGFTIGTNDGKQLLFNQLNEAITTGLQINFEKVYFDKWPEIEANIKLRNEAVEYVAKRDETSIEELKQKVARVDGDQSSGYKLVTYSYRVERGQFNLLIDELYEKNKSDFESRDQIFSLFTQAAMTGRLLPVARLIEKTYGKGTFRIGAEKTADKSARAKQEQE